MYKTQQLRTPTQSTQHSQEIDKKSLFQDCLTYIINHNDVSLLECFSSSCYDLTQVLYDSLEDHSDMYSPCCHFLVRAINQDTNRFQFDQDIADGYDDDFAIALLNYGLRYEIIEKMTPPQILHVHIQRHKIKCEVLRKQFALLIPNDVFSLLKPFITYDLQI